MIHPGRRTVGHFFEMYQPQAGALGLVVNRFLSGGADGLVLTSSGTHSSSSSKSSPRRRPPSRPQWPSAGHAVLTSSFFAAGFAAGGPGCPGGHQLLGATAVALLDPLGHPVQREVARQVRPSPTRFYQARTRSVRRRQRQRQPPGRRRFTSFKVLRAERNTNVFPLTLIAMIPRMPGGPGEPEGAVAEYSRLRQTVWGGHGSSAGLRITPRDGGRQAEPVAGRWGTLAQ